MRTGGKTLAVDGTLMAYRFHHVTYEDNQTVALWHRFLNLLHKEHNILPICVFDGKCRLPEKKKEVQRRIEVRELMEARGLLEKDRGKRLRELADAFKSLRDLPADKASLIIEHARESQRSQVSTIVEETAPGIFHFFSPHFGTEI
jgi:5'-3' exonuclease